jgi:hypothetical protein
MDSDRVAPDGIAPLAIDIRLVAQQGRVFQLRHDVLVRSLLLAIRNSSLFCHPAIFPENRGQSPNSRQFFRENRALTPNFRMAPRRLCWHGFAVAASILLMDLTCEVPFSQAGSGGARGCRVPLLIWIKAHSLSDLNAIMMVLVRLTTR